MPLDSEYELMQRLSAGNEDAFGELFGRYYPRVCAFVGCIVKEESTAEDIAQDIFLKIWERRDIFQGRVASFNGYVYRMARNAALNAIRQMTNIDWEQYIQIEETLPDESFEKEYYSREKELFIRLVVCRMPEQRRRIFEMSRYAGMDNQAIADELKISKRTVENHLTLALKNYARHWPFSRFFSLCTDLIRRVIPKKVFIVVCRTVPGCLIYRDGDRAFPPHPPGKRQGAPASLSAGEFETQTIEIPLCRESEKSSVFI